MLFRECRTYAERVALAERLPAEVIKARLVEFLGWSVNRDKARLLYEWEEVVEALLDDEVAAPPAADNAPRDGQEQP